MNIQQKHTRTNNSLTKNPISTHNKYSVFLLQKFKNWTKNLFAFNLNRSIWFNSFDFDVRWFNSYTNTHTPHMTEMNCLTFKHWLTLSHTSSWNYITQQHLVCLVLCFTSFVHEVSNDKSTMNNRSLCVHFDWCLVFCAWCLVLSVMMNIMRRICAGLLLSMLLLLLTLLLCILNFFLFFFSVDFVEMVPNARPLLTASLHSIHILHIMNFEIRDFR